ncbi:MAG: hypothetical protein Q8N56_02985 [bacterium]|nr:hypothetical protein [bacterium]
MGVHMRRRDSGISAFFLNVVPATVVTWVISSFLIMFFWNLLAPQVIVGADKINFIQALIIRAFVYLFSFRINISESE